MSIQVAAALLFFVSGVAALVLETVFLRQLSWLAGSAVIATALVLAGFMGGLAAGSAVLGARADRAEHPLRLYAVLEIGVGISSAALVLLLSFGRELLLAPARALGGGPSGDAWTYFVSVALLLCPTFLMGGTLPALTRFVVRGTRGLTRSVGNLYGWNTLGAAVGAVAGGLFLFERIGIVRSGLLASGAAILVGVAAWAIAAAPSSERGASADSSSKPIGTRAPQLDSSLDAAGSRARTACVVAAALGGAAVLGYEVVWTRLLSLAFRSFAYSFSAMLGLFLCGLVLGSFLVARLAPRLRAPLQALGWIELAIGAWVAGSLFWIPRLLAPPSEAGSFLGFLLAASMQGVPVVVPPTLLSGMALPLAAGIVAAKRDRIGRDVGRVVAANTCGAIVGALLTGLFLLPTLGATRSLAVLALINVAAGLQALRAAAVSSQRMLAALALSAACAAMIFAPRAPFIEGFLRASHGRETIGDILLFREGAADTVAVVRKNYGFIDPHAKSVIVNGIAMTATVKPVWRYMAAEGHLPAFLAPKTERALVLCVGTGITLGALVSHARVRSVTAVDLSEGILEALPLFAAENAAAYADPKVRLVRADGRHFLETSSESWDLITLEPPPPIVAGSVNLYSLDFYHLCRLRLEPGGVVAQWLPLHAQSLASARMTAKTFLKAFPHTQLWLPSIRDAVLIGSDRPIELPLKRLRAPFASATTHRNLSAAYLESPEVLLATFLLDRTGIEQWCEGSPLVTDDRPRMEFFRRYGPNMKDPEIATLLAPELGDFRFVQGLEADPNLAARLATEREAQLLYLQSEIDNRADLAHAAARKSQGTNFYLYRLGCDPAQLDTLKEMGDQKKWTTQMGRCKQFRAVR